MKRFSCNTPFLIFGAIIFLFSGLFVGYKAGNDNAIGREMGRNWVYFPTGLIEIIENDKGDEESKEMKTAALQALDSQVDCSLANAMSLDKSLFLSARTRGRLELVLKDVVQFRSTQPSKWICTDKATAKTKKLYAEAQTRFGKK